MGAFTASRAGAGMSAVRLPGPSAPNRRRAPARQCPSQRPERVREPLQGSACPGKIVNNHSCSISNRAISPCRRSQPCRTIVVADRAGALLGMVIVCFRSGHHASAISHADFRDRYALHAGSGLACHLFDSQMQNQSVMSALVRLSPLGAGQYKRLATTQRERARRVPWLPRDCPVAAP